MSNDFVNESFRNLMCCRLKGSFSRICSRIMGMSSIRRRENFENKGRLPSMDIF